MGEPWAYVAHKDGKMGGVCATSISKKSLRDFLGEFAADGFTLTAVFSRDEYMKFIASMPAWHGDDDTPAWSQSE